MTLCFNIMERGEERKLWALDRTWDLNQGENERSGHVVPSWDKRAALKGINKLIICFLLIDGWREGGRVVYWIMCSDSHLDGNLVLNGIDSPVPTAQLTPSLNYIFIHWELLRIQVNTKCRQDAWKNKFKNWNTVGAITLFVCVCVSVCVCVCLSVVWKRPPIDWHSHQSITTEVECGTDMINPMIWTKG